MVKKSVKRGGLFMDGKKEKCGGAKKKCPRGHKVCRCKSKKSKKRSKSKKNSKKRSKKSSKKSSKSKQGGGVKIKDASSCPKLKDPELKALCMKCFHSSGKKIKSRGMDMNGRVCTVNSRGRHMIQGKCVVCSGKMTVFV